MGLRAINQQQLHTVPETATLNLNQEQAIEIHGLTFNRGQRQVLDIRRLNIPKGAIVAVVGENGAGIVATAIANLAIMAPVSLLMVVTMALLDKLCAGKGLTLRTDVILLMAIGLCGMILLTQWIYGCGK